MNSADREPALALGLVQLKPAKADLDTNLEKIRGFIAEQGSDRDLLVFPESSTTGYFLEGGVSEVALSVDQLAEALGRPHPGAPDVVLGFYERWRRRLYNSVAYLTPDGESWATVHVHRKMFLPTYGVFQEARFVEPGTQLEAFDTRLGRMGMMICEELWHSVVPTVLALDGAELLLCVSASPARDFRPGVGEPGVVTRWRELAVGAAREHGVFVAVCQLVGSEGGKMFSGCSSVIAPDGREVARGPFLEEGVTSAILDGADLDRARADSPLLADLEQMLPHLQRAFESTRSKSTGGRHGRDASSSDLRGLRNGSRGNAVPRPGDTSMLDLDVALVEETLVSFIHDEVVRQRGFERVVIGVSGGVDSAVSLLLAVRALGPENVVGFRLPYSTSSQESLDHAQLVLDQAGARCETIDITPAVDGYIQSDDLDISPLRRGNLAARSRAVTLFDQSAKLDALPLGTGNKSERLLGYYTWHADDAPPINPLGDLFKTQVWALARHIGVPNQIVDKPASADLVRGVHDEDELGISYHKADPILYWLLNGYSPADLKEAGFDAEEVSLVWRRVDTTHWKRELPTVAVLSSSAIGEFYLRPVDY
jgi:NAD+ synthetase